jgi:hypothetical protein
LLARESWTQALDNGSRLDVIFVDFSKAFDKVPHRRLLLKLQAYGIHGKLLAWISAFLSDRQLLVKVNGALSDTTSPTSGVPQGSVLGPELFKLYVNDLPGVLNIDCILYADDLKLWARTSSTEGTIALWSALDAL